MLITEKVMIVLHFFFLQPISSLTRLRFKCGQCSKSEWNRYLMMFADYPVKAQFSRLSVSKQAWSNHVSLQWMAILTEAQNFIRLKALSAAQCGTSSTPINAWIGKWATDVCTCRTRSECEESIISMQQNTQARDPLWLWNPRQISPEVQNKGISGLMLNGNNVL